MRDKNNTIKQNISMARESECVQRQNKCETHWIYEYIQIATSTYISFAHTACEVVFSSLLRFYSKNSILIWCFFLFCVRFAFFSGFVLFDCHCQRRRTRDSRPFASYTNARAILSKYLSFYFAVNTLNSSNTWNA